MSCQKHRKQPSTLGIVAQNELFSRSYLDTGLLKVLSDRFSIEILFSTSDEGLGVKLQNERFIIRDLSRAFSPKIIRKSKKITKISWVTSRRKSPSFLFWHKRYMLGDSLWFPRHGNLKFKLRMLFRGINHLRVRLLRDFKYFILFISPLNDLRLARQIEGFPSTKLLENEIKNYGAILLQGVGTEPEVLPILIACKKLGIPTILVIDNWDNLTSKNVLKVLPNFVTVLGEIDRLNAERIHGFASEKIWAIGLPKFLSIKSRESNQSNPEKICRILYLGFSLPHAEKKFLNELSRELIRSTPVLNFEITYRPHPAQKPRSFDEDLSDKILQVTPTSLNLNGGLPRLDQNYLDSLLEYDLVIGTPTTLLLECMLLGIPCLCDLSDDGLHRTTAAFAAKHYLHMMDLFSLGQVQVATSAKEMANSIAQHLSKTGTKTAYNLEELVALPPSDFPKRLIAELERILGSHS